LNGKGAVRNIFNALLLLGAFIFNVPVLQAAENPNIKGEIQQLRAQMEKIMQRIEQLEAQQPGISSLESTSTRDEAKVGSSVLAATPKSPEVAIMDDVSATAKPQGRGFLELNHNDSVLSFGGRISADAVYDWPDGSFSPKTAPLDSSGENGQLKYDLRNSRLWFKTRTPSEWGMVRTLIEADFWGSSGNETNNNSHNLRLRHAYLEVGGLKIGQTWTTFLPYATADTMMDPANINWIRQPQIRWTIESNDFTYALALENPETILTDTLGSDLAPDDDQLPDFVASVSRTDDWGGASASVLLRQIRQDKATPSGGSEFNKSDEAFAWGVGASARIKTVGDDDIRFGFQYGDGIGRYVAGQAYGAGSIDDQGNIDLQTAWGTYAAYRHWWSPKWRSTFAFALAGTDNNINVVPNSVNKDAMSYQMNLFWTPFENSLFGLEYGHMERELESGQTGEIDTLYMRALYDF